MENMRELIDKLNYYTKKYDEGAPEISDKDWDDMYFELKVGRNCWSCLCELSNSKYQLSGCQ